MVIDKPTQERPPVIGPRLRAELERRVRELQGRAKPTPREMRELAQLKDFLRITPIEGQRHSETAEGCHSLDRLWPYETEGRSPWLCTHYRRQTRQQSRSLS